MNKKWQEIMRMLIGLKVLTAEGITEVAECEKCAHVS
jgi:hypothetical protein